MPFSLFLMNEWLLLALLLTFIEGATWLGLEKGRKQQGQEAKNSESQIGTVLGAVLGLLALLLAFTFSLGADRFDLRKQLVVEEANALSTLNLRAQLLPEPLSTRVQKLIRAYVDADVDFYRAGVSVPKLEAVEARITKLQAALWSEGRAVAALDPRSMVTLLFIQTLNETLDLHETRLAAMDNHVPEAVLWVLIFIAILSAGMLGFASGLGPSRDRIPVLLSSLLIVLVMSMVFDLGRPRRGMITSGQGGILRLQRALQRPSQAPGE